MVMLDTNMFDTLDRISDKALKWVPIIIAPIFVVIFIAAGVVGAKSRDGLAYTQVCDGKTVEITADDAFRGSEFRKSRIQVAPGEGIVIEAHLEQGHIRVYAASGWREAIDEEIEGDRTIELEVDPGEWTIGTEPDDGATGTMTVTAR